MPKPVSWFGEARYYLRRFIVHGRIRVTLQYLFAKFQTLFIQPTILPYFITFFPHRRSSYAYKIPKRETRTEVDPNDLPTPPERLWLSYGKTIEDWLASGKEHVGNMRNVLSAGGFNFEQGNRVLEMGCAGGRMLRWLGDATDRCEIWGTDISGDHITWCKQHMSPPFHFFITTQYPHLPFTDGYFDLIYAGSVFTHIDDLADSWMLELRRLLKPGGRLYVTMHDNHTIRMLSDGGDDLAKTMNCRRDFFKNDDYAMFTIGRFMRSQVFYDQDYLVESWKPFFDTQSVTPGAYGFQTGYLFQRK